MKVTKIDIKKTVMDVKPNKEYLEVAICNELNKIMKDGETPSHETIEFKKKVYQMQKIYNSFAREKIKHYYVELDDREMFSELAKINIKQLEDKITDSYNKGGEAGYRNGHNIGFCDGFKAVKQMPWWKRLFKKF